MTMYFSPCPLCGREASKSELADVTKVDCEHCCVFAVTGSGEAVLTNIEQRLKNKVGFWTRDQNDLGELPMVTSHTIEEVLKLPEKTLMERAERLLRFGIKQQRDLGGMFKLPSPQTVAISHSQSDEDVYALAGFLSEQHWLSYSNGDAQVRPGGFIHAAEAKVSESVNGFVAMWFDPSLNAARMNGLEPAIRGAGYTPVIVSGVEHINKIDDEIISQIRRSKFLVADFTGHRGGVYFEAGFAMGLGLPVFWTCRKDHLSDLHFDVRQYNCIDWADPADLAARLRRRIEAVIGIGPVKNNSAGSL